jgi:hypothetical protein
VECQKYNIDVEKSHTEQKPVIMAKILARLTLLLIGANACTPQIMDSVRGQDE